MKEVVAVALLALSASPAFAVDISKLLDTHHEVGGIAISARGDSAEECKLNLGKVEAVLNSANKVITYIGKCALDQYQDGVWIAQIDSF